MDQQTRYVDYFITIDSRDRDRQAWPTSSQFEVKLEPPDNFSGATLSRNFKNIKSIELVSAIIPNQNNVLNEMYLYLTIPEIDGNFVSTNLEGQKAFAKLIPRNTFGNFIHCFVDEVDRPRKVFKANGVRLDKLTINVKRWNGDLFTFGSDTNPPSHPNNSLQVALTLKVTIAEPHIR